MSMTAPLAAAPLAGGAPTMAEKRCPKCGKVKLQSDFWRDAVGYFARCKVCHVGPRPDPGAKCACGRMAEAKCLCGLNLCEGHWWRHSHYAGEAP